eukprot:gene22473-29594_t
MMKLPLDRPSVDDPADPEKLISLLKDLGSMKRDLGSPDDPFKSDNLMKCSSFSSVMDSTLTDASSSYARSSFSRWSSNTRGDDESDEDDMYFDAAKHFTVDEDHYADSGRVPLPAHATATMEQDIETVMMSTLSALSAHRMDGVTGAIARSVNSIGVSRGDITRVHIAVPWSEPGELAPDAIANLKSKLAAKFSSTAIVGHTIRRGSLLIAFDILTAGALWVGEARETSVQPSPKDWLKWMQLPWPKDGNTLFVQVGVDLLGGSKGSLLIAFDILTAGALWVGEARETSVQPSPKDWLKWMQLPWPKDGNTLFVQVGVDLLGGSKGSLLIAFDILTAGALWVGEARETSVQPSPKDWLKWMQLPWPKDGNTLFVQVGVDLLGGSKGSLLIAFDILTAGALWVGEARETSVQPSPKDWLKWMQLPWPKDGNTLFVQVGVDLLGGSKGSLLIAFDILTAGALWVGEARETSVQPSPKDWLKWMQLPWPKDGNTLFVQVGVDLLGGSKGSLLIAFDILTAGALWVGEARETSVQPSPKDWLKWMQLPWPKDGNTLFVQVGVDLLGGSKGSLLIAFDILTAGALWVGEARETSVQPSPKDWLKWMQLPWPKDGNTLFVQVGVDLLGGSKGSLLIAFDILTAGALWVGEARETSVQPSPKDWLKWMQLPWPKDGNTLFVQVGVDLLGGSKGSLLIAFDILTAGALWVGEARETSVQPSPKDWLKWMQLPWPKDGNTLFVQVGVDLLGGSKGSLLIAFDILTAGALWVGEARETSVQPSPKDWLKWMQLPWPKDGNTLFVQVGVDLLGGSKGSLLIAFDILTAGALWVGEARETSVQPSPKDWLKWMQLPWPKDGNTLFVQVGVDLLGGSKGSLLIAFDILTAGALWVGEARETSVQPSPKDWLKWMQLPWPKDGNTLFVQVGVDLLGGSKGSLLIAFDILTAGALWVGEARETSVQPSPKDWLKWMQLPWPKDGNTLFVQVGVDLLGGSKGSLLIAFDILTAGALWVGEARETSVQPSPKDWLKWMQLPWPKDGNTLFVQVGVDLLGGSKGSLLIAFDILTAGALWVGEARETSVQPSPKDWLKWMQLPWPKDGNTLFVQVGVDLLGGSKGSLLIAFDILTAGALWVGEARETSVQPSPKDWLKWMQLPWPKDGNTLFVQVGVDLLGGSKGSLLIAFDILTAGALWVGEARETSVQPSPKDWLKWMQLPWPKDGNTLFVQVGVDLLGGSKGSLLIAFDILTAGALWVGEARETSVQPSPKDWLKWMQLPWPKDGNTLFVQVGVDLLGGSKGSLLIAFDILTAGALWVGEARETSVQPSPKDWLKWMQLPWPKDGNTLFVQVGVDLLGGSKGSLLIAFDILTAGALWVGEARETSVQPSPKDWLKWMQLPWPKDGNTLFVQVGVDLLGGSKGSLLIAFDILTAGALWVGEARETSVQPSPKDWLKWMQLPWPKDGNTLFVQVGVDLLGGSKGSLLIAFDILTAGALWVGEARETSVQPSPKDWLKWMQLPWPKDGNTLFVQVGVDLLGGSKGSLLIAFDILTAGALWVGEARETSVQPSPKDWLKWMQLPWPKDGNTLFVQVGVDLLGGSKGSLLIAFDILTAGALWVGEARETSVQPSPKDWLKWMQLPWPKDGNTLFVQVGVDLLGGSKGSLLIAFDILTAGALWVGEARETSVQPSPKDWLKWMQLPWPKDGNTLFVQVGVDLLGGSKGSLLIAFDILTAGALWVGEARETSVQPSPKDWLKWMQLPWPKDGNTLFVQVGVDLLGGSKGSLLIAFDILTAGALWVGEARETSVQPSPKDWLKWMQLPWPKDGKHVVRPGEARETSVQPSPKDWLKWIAVALAKGRKHVVRPAQPKGLAEVDAVALAKGRKHVVRPGGVDLLGGSKGSLLIAFDILTAGALWVGEARETSVQPSPKDWLKWMQLPWPKDGNTLFVQVGVDLLGGSKGSLLIAFDILTAGALWVGEARETSVQPSPKDWLKWMQLPWPKDGNTLFVQESPAREPLVCAAPPRTWLKWSVALAKDGITLFVARRSPGDLCAAQPKGLAEVDAVPWPKDGNTLFVQVGVDLLGGSKGSLLIAFDILTAGALWVGEAREDLCAAQPKDWLKWMQLPWPKDGNTFFVQGEARETSVQPSPKDWLKWMQLPWPKDGNTLFVQSSKALSTVPGQGDYVLKARCRGSVLPVHVTKVDFSESPLEGFSSLNDDVLCVTLDLGDAKGPAVAMLEVWVGRIVVQSIPLLVLPERMSAIATEMDTLSFSSEADIGKSNGV